MKNTPVIIGVPALVILLIIASVFAWKMAQPQTALTPADQYTMEEPTLNDETTKPASSFGDEDVISADPDVAGMKQDLESTADDGGKTDLDSLDQDAAAL